MRVGLFVVYNPDETELWLRAELMRIMTHEGWSPDITQSIMVDDNPDWLTVRRLIRENGLRRAYDLIKKMHNDH